MCSMCTTGACIPKPSQIMNYDETSWHTNIDLEYIYAPEEVGRTLAPTGGNDFRERVTCIPMLMANGTVGPTMMIVHDSSSMHTPDQLSMTVLDTLLRYLRIHGNNGSDIDLWERKVYEKTLTKPKCRQSRKRKASAMKDGSSTPSNNMDWLFTRKYNRIFTTV